MMDSSLFDNIDNMMEYIMSLIKEMEDDFPLGADMSLCIGNISEYPMENGNSYNDSTVSLSAPSIHSFYSDEKKDVSPLSPIDAEELKIDNEKSHADCNLDSDAIFRALQKRRLIVSAGNSPVLSRNLNSKAHGQNEEEKNALSMKLLIPDIVKFDVEILCPDGQLFKYFVFKVWTAAQLSWKIALIKGMSEKLGLVIQEYITELHLVRAIEDHEVIYDIIQNWAPDSSNKLQMVEDFSKFDLFNNPSDFLPTELLDISYNNTLENKADFVNGNLFNFIVKADTVLDVQHWVFMKEFHKKKWTRVFLKIKNSVLYLCDNDKGTGYCAQIYSCKDSYFYECLDEFHNAHKPPHSNCFCIIPSVVNKWRQIKCFSVESRQLLVGWMTAFRLAKYGDQLFKNFCEAIAKEENSHATSYRQTVLTKWKRLSEEGTIEDNKAAVDFSGNNSRVISDPREALQIQNQLGFEIPRPIKRRSETFSPMTFRRAILSDKVWYHGKLQREQAIWKLKKNGMKDGLFLVRESCSSQGNLVLSVVKKGKISHHQIFQKVSPAGKPLYGMEHGPQFISLEQFIEYYNSGSLDGTDVLLKKPCPAT